MLRKLSSEEDDDAIPTGDVGVFALLAPAAAAALGDGNCSGKSDCVGDWLGDDRGRTLGQRRRLFHADSS